MSAVAGLGFKVCHRLDVKEDVVLDALVVPRGHHVPPRQLLVSAEPPQVVGKLEVFLFLSQLAAAVVGRWKETVNLKSRLLNFFSSSLLTLQQNKLGCVSLASLNWR